MGKVKDAKHDEYVEIAKKIVAYVNPKELIIGVYADVDDMKKANNNLAVKKLKNLYRYKIQMVIK
jgi:ABC-type Fe3+-citrate transport system substrate-binding protein